MISKIFFLVLVAGISFVANAKDSDWAISSKTIKWIDSEPLELTSTADYKKWKKTYGILPGVTDGKYRSIRYGYEDVTNDGNNEIVVQEAMPYDNGYAFAVFEKKNGRAWRSIADGRGAFIFLNLYNKQPYTLIKYEKLYADYYRVKLQYKNGSFSIVKHDDLEKDITAYAMNFYDYFWSLNFSKYQYCRYQLGVSNNLYDEKGNKLDFCKVAVYQKLREIGSYCDMEDYQKYQKEECK